MAQAWVVRSSPPTKKSRQTEERLTISTNACFRARLVYHALFAVVLIGSHVGAVFVV